jgi:hypothetical protein
MVDKDRRAALRGLVSVGLGAAALATGARTAKAQEKLAQNIVQYQETPNAGNECDKCVNWVAPNQCKIVAGTINPKGWCVAFAPKDG